MLGPRRWSIRSWLGTFAAAVAVPLLVLLTWLFSSEIRREESEARETALRAARATAARLQAMHEDSVALLDRIARRPSLRNFGQGACESLFAVVDFDPLDENLFFFDRGGQLLCAGAARPENVAVSAEAQHWVERELRGGRLPARVPRMTALADRWVVALATPVADGRGAPRGVIVLVQLPEVVETASLPPHSVITVLDDRGTILARSAEPQTWGGRNVRGSELTELALRTKEGQTEAIGVDGVSRQYGFTYVPELGWHVSVGVPTDEVMRPVRRLMLRGVAGGIGIVILIAAMALLLARQIAKPINRLARAAGAIAAGTHANVSTVEGPREIALLAKTFNHMVESRSHSEAHLQESERNLKALSERVLAVQEEERTRIAREIHDDLGQSLTALKMDVVGLLDRSGSSPAAAPLRERILRTLDATVTAVQRISAELRPTMLDDLGLSAAVETEARLFEERTGIECEVSLPPEDELQVDRRSATAMYRIIQEGLTNVLRHSDAARVELRVRRRGDELLLEIRDDGRGVASEAIEDPASLGLVGMRERAAMLGGSVHFEGVAGRGTIVSVRIPSPLTRSRA